MAKEKTKIENLLNHIENGINLSDVYDSPEDSVGTFACCGNPSYTEHENNCPIRVLKELAKLVREEIQMIDFTPEMQAQYDKEVIFDVRIIADTVLNAPIKNQYESIRQKLTAKQRKDFIDEVEDRCKGAFKIKADWFMKCVRAKGNKGRDQMYVWITQWLESFINRLS